MEFFKIIFRKELKRKEKSFLIILEKVVGRKIIDSCYIKLIYCYLDVFLFSLEIGGMVIVFINIIFEECLKNLENFFINYIYYLNFK